MVAYALTATDIIRRDDGTFIPPDPDNSDYSEYLDWLEDGNVPLPYVEPPIPKPQSVSRFQARVALFQAGLLPQIDLIMANPATPMLTKLAWADASEFNRDSPTLNALASTMGLSSAQVDALFTAAAAIKA